MSSALPGRKCSPCAQGATGTARGPLRRDLGDGVSELLLRDGYGTESLVTPK